MRGFGFIPDWNKSPSRIHEEAYFPVSLSGTHRAATFSETLSGILGADPQHSSKDFEEAFKSHPDIAGDETIQKELWRAFSSAYATSSEGGVRSKHAEAGDYITPFHRKIAATQKIEQSRNWERLYWLLMTRSGGNVDRDLHDNLVDALEEMDASNLLERLVIEAIDEFEGEVTASDSTTSETIEYNPIEPLITECSEAFRADLDAWLGVRDDESTARWMRGLQDLLCFHYVMYVIQAALGLHYEYQHLSNGEDPQKYEFELQPIYFGLTSETASQSRKFRNEWKEGEISRALYDSWGRLVVQRHLVEIGLDKETPVNNRPYTLTEALETFPPELQRRAGNQIIAEFKDEDLEKHFPDDPMEEYDLDDVAVRFSHAVRRYYENMAKTKNSQTAYSAGENSVLDLARGTERQFLQSRSGVGTISVLDRAGLRLFAQLFDNQTDRGHIDEFWVYMQDRGINFDERTEQALIEQLDGMGLLQRQSDSGEAMYVQTV